MLVARRRPHQSPTALRPPAIAPTVDAARRPEALVVGGPLPGVDAGRLRAHGWQLRTALDLRAARAMLARDVFDAIVVFPHVDRRADGLGLVASLKPEVSAPSDWRARYAKVPVLVMPLEGDSEFALFRTRRDFELLDAQRVSLADALLRAWAA